MEYFHNGLQGLRASAECSDNACPCSPSVEFQPGEGYLFVSREAVAFRRNARSLEEAQAKLQQLTERDTVRWSGIMICERAAKRRNLDLRVASEDARRWWRTGDMPLRPTPTVRRWWQFWR